MVVLSTKPDHPLKPSDALIITQDETNWSNILIAMVWGRLQGCTILFDPTSVTEFPIEKH